MEIIVTIFKNLCVAGHVLTTLYIISFTSYNNLIRWASSPFSGKTMEAPEKLNNLIKITQLISVKAKTWAQSCLTPKPSLFLLPTASAQHSEEPSLWTWFREMQPRNFGVQDFCAYNVKSVWDVGGNQQLQTCLTTCKKQKSSWKTRLAKLR